MRRQFADLLFVAIERMPGDIEAEQFLFALQFLLERPVVALRQYGFGMFFGAVAKKPPNSPACPLSRSLAARLPVSIAASSASSSCARVPCNESIAPALTRLSITRRLIAVMSACSQN